MTGRSRSRSAYHCTRDELLIGAGTLVRAADDEQTLLDASRAAGLSPRPDGDGNVVIDADRPHHPASPMTPRSPRTRDAG